MEQSIWSDFFMKQAPVIIVLSLFCYFMYKYLTGVIAAKEVIIQAKDKRMEELLEEYMELQKLAIESYLKLTNILQTVFDEVKQIRNSGNK